MLDDDFEATKSYTFNTDKTIDLNGYEINAELDEPLFNVRGGTLTLTGGNIENNGIVVNVTNGSVIFDTGSYVSNVSDAVHVGPNGTVIVEDETEILGNENGISISGSGDDGCNATITVNGGSIEGDNNSAIVTSENPGEGKNHITIHGGYLESSVRSDGYESAGVYIANDDVFEMDGGRIYAYGGTGLCMRGGQVTINGGSITAVSGNRTGRRVPDGVVGTDPTVLTGSSGIVYHKVTNHPGSDNMSLTVTNGTITGDDKSIDVISDEETPNITITGGTLTPPYNMNEPEPEPGNEP